MSNEQLGSLDQKPTFYRKVGRRGLRRRSNDASIGPAWTRFAAAAGASLAAASNADAAIQHIVPASPLRVDVMIGPLTAGTNLDGIPGNDLGIRVGGFLRTFNTFSYSGFQFVGLAYGLGGAALIGDSVVGTYGNIAVRRFNAGEEIPAATPSLSGSLLQLSATSLYGYFNPVTYRGQFGISGSGYAGFVNSIGGSLHAGWIKIRTESFLFNGVQRLRAIEIDQWAYEDEAGESILAGQTMSVGGPDGDYNDDNVVDAADYTVWRDKLGTNDPLPNDPNGGTIDQDQYNTWRDNFGAIAGAGSGAGATGSASAAGAVPEPSTISLGVLALGAAGVAALRRRT